MLLDIYPRPSVQESRQTAASELGPWLRVPGGPTEVGHRVQGVAFIKHLLHARWNLTEGLGVGSEEGTPDWLESEEASWRRQHQFWPPGWPGLGHKDREGIQG